jgi:hypothetical protein
MAETEYFTQPTVLCLKCGMLMDPVLLELGDKLHPMCASRLPVRDVPMAHMSTRTSKKVTIPLGDQLAVEGQERAWDATGEPWRKRAQRAISSLCERGIPFTAEDVRRLAGDPDSQNAMGAALGKASREGLIYTSGFTKPQRASRHSNMLRLWHKAT